MAGRKRARRSGGRAPRHVFHAALRALRQVVQPGRHRTGDRTVSGAKRPNPWPKCPQCLHRHPAEDYCPRCLCCSSCCQRCEKCHRCLLDCPGHDRSTGQGESTTPTDL